MSVEGWEMYVKIDIADTGIGISEQHQGTIFKRFYREDAVHDVDGIGIGLYLAREIVTFHFFGACLLYFRSRKTEKVDPLHRKGRICSHRGNLRQR